MPEASTPAPTTDPAKLLAQLEGLIKKNTTTTEKGETKSNSWVGTLIIVVVALAAVAVFAWISWRNNKELAKLRHEEEKRKILAEKAVVDKQVATNQAKIDSLQKDLVVLEDERRIIAADIKHAEERHEADKRAIDRIRSWDDVPGSS